MTLPTNIDATYSDVGGLGRKQHQQNHDTIHGRLNGLSGEFAPIVHMQPSSTITDFTEAVQDAVAALLGAGSNITLNYDDAGNTLTVTALGDGTGLDAEAVRDAIGVALVGVGNIAVTVNDALDTITISTTATVNSTDAVLLNRANHSGTQTLATISDAGTAASRNTGTADGDIPLLSTGGVLPIARLATGTPDGTKFIRDDGTLAPAGSSAPFKVNTAGDTIIPVDTQDSWVIGSDRFDRDAADTTKDRRAFFNKVKGAFRAGTAEGTQWDDVNIGVVSHAEGTSTIASGTASHAEGSTTTSSAVASHAEGRSTTASNTAAHAEGDVTTASGAASHAEGSNTIANNTNSHAEGSSTTASGTSAHAEGNSTVASGISAHAEGTGAQATGNYSHAAGRESLASRHGQWATSGGANTAFGDAQMSAMIVKKITTDAVAIPLRAGADGDPVQLAGPTANVLTITASRAYTLKISTVARRTDVQGEMAGFTWEGLVGRDSTGNARIIGAPVVNKWNDAGAAAYAVAVSIDTTDPTNNFVAVTVTGEAAKTIRWVAKMEWVEVGG